MTKTASTTLATTANDGARFGAFARFPAPSGPAPSGVAAAVPLVD